MFGESQCSALFAPGLTALTCSTAIPAPTPLVLIGEVGGLLPGEAADFIASELEKPVVAFIASATIAGSTG